MYVNVTLYKTKLSTTDTMVFSSKIEQTSFFAGLPQRELGKCSFNGKRTIRINGNYFMLNIGGYNYIKIYYIDGYGNERTYYAFIDLFRYVNDNCCEVDVTTDYIQTYMFDIQFSQLFIEQRNYSINDKVLFNLPYKNIYPIGNYKLKNYSELNNKPFICVLLDGSAQNPAGGGGTVGEVFGDIYLKTPTDISESEEIYTTKIVCLIFPITIQQNGTFTVDDTFIDGYNTTHNCVNFSSFISEFSSVIMNISIIDALPLFYGGKLNTDNFLLTANAYGAEADGYYIAYTGVKTNDVFAFVDTYFNSNYSLLRSPYYNLYIYRRGYNQTLVNIFNCDVEMDSNSIRYLVKFLQDIIPSSDVIVDYSDKYKFNSAKIQALSSTLPFSVDAWDNYRLSKSATSSDALATKHAYDMEIADRNYQNARNQSRTSFITGMTNALGSAVSAGGAGLVGKPEAGIGSLVNSITGVVGSSLNYHQNLENASVAYENTKTTIEQESALLELQYNDIKNSPDITKNFYDSNGYSTMWYGKIRLDVYEAGNIDEIIKYHKRFGFETALQTEITDLRGLHDVNARHFDYIRTLNCNVISENIPRTSAEMIQKIFNSGIYLWRNYEKLGEDYLSNYRGE